MFIDYNLMKKGREPYFELSEKELVLYIDHLIFKGEDGLYKFRLYAIKKIKNIEASLLVLELKEEEDKNMLLKEKYKYQSVTYQFDMMLDDIAIRNKIIGITK